MRSTASTLARHLHVHDEAEHRGATPRRGRRRRRFRRSSAASTSSACPSRSSRPYGIDRRPDHRRAAGRHGHRAREGHHPQHGAARAEAGRGRAGARSGDAAAAVRRQGAGRHGRRGRRAGVAATRSDAAFYLVRKVRGDHRPRPAQRASRRSTSTTCRPSSFTLNSEGVAKFSARDRRQRRPPARDHPRRPRACRRRASRPRSRSRRRGSPARFTQQEAQDLALMLRSGALPASLDAIRSSARSARRSAQDSIRAGVMASLIGLGLVTLFMLVYYRLAGINAFVSVALNLIILLGLHGVPRRGHDAAGHRGLHPDDRHGRRLERADLRAHPRGTRRPRRARGRRSPPASIACSSRSSTRTSRRSSRRRSCSSSAPGPIRGFATTLFFGLISQRVHRRLRLAHAVRVHPLAKAGRRDAS